MLPTILGIRRAHDEGSARDGYHIGFMWLGLGGGDCRNYSLPINPQLKNENDRSARECISPVSPILPAGDDPYTRDAPQCLAGGPGPLSKQKQLNKISQLRPLSCQTLYSRSGSSGKPRNCRDISGPGMGPIGPAKATPDH